MPGFRMFGQIIDSYKQSVYKRVQNINDVVLRAGIVAVIASVILWVAIFMYIAFYYAYMPSISYTRPVHLQFQSCEKDKGICGFPYAHVRLTRRHQLLMVGQSYKFFLNLELPESPANKRLGMFLTCMQLQGKGGVLVAHSCRSGMLHYRSRLLHYLTTLVFSPILLFGSAEEKQTLTLELFSDFEEDQKNPVTDIFVEIQTRHIELYSATLNVNAHLTGLRYLMFHWPLLSAAFGISTNLFFMVLIATLSWWHLIKSDTEGPVSYLYSRHEKTKPSLVLKNESDESSFEIEDTSLSEEMVKIKPVPETITLASGSRVHVKELSRSDSFDLIGEQSEC